MAKGKDKKSDVWGNTKSVSVGLIPGRRVLGPLFLVSVTPLWAIFVQITMRKHKGAVTSAVSEFVGCAQRGELWQCTKENWPSATDPNAITFLLAYMTAQLLVMEFMPCKKFKGPVTPMGNTPVYNANGVQAWVTTVVVFLAGVWLGLWNGGIFYDIMPEMISSLNVFSLVFCLFLYVKGFLAPSTSDTAFSSSPIFDYYAGVELYPRILGCDIKQFTNCRFGMTYWGIAPISFALKQYELYGEISDSMLVSVALQVIYVTKFFIWETGYFDTIDIMHDRAGFMLCWGCLVWVPSIYTITSQFLVEHPMEFGNMAWVVFVCGVLSIGLNYHSDRQRQKFRQLNGKMNIWGKPAKFIEASYKTDDGKTRTSKLLLSGWWGMFRKVNYVFELLAALSWSISGTTHCLPYFYFVFLVILLVDRAFRDDARCRSKYGAKWDEYCAQVPYMLIPGLL